MFLTPTSGQPLSEVKGESPATTLTGGSSPYYSVRITRPVTPGRYPYIAECQDIIEALGLNFAQGNAFKALWRMGATQQGWGKPGTSLLYDAEKVEFFGGREVARLTPAYTSFENDPPKYAKPEHYVLLSTPGAAES